MTGQRLEGIGLGKRYGGLAALSDVSLRAEPGQILAVIGPNGAGKTTLFSCLTGVERPDEGRVLLDGRDITRLPFDARARRGVGRTFQRLAVFATLSVEDNLRVGAEARRPGSLLRGLAGLREPTGRENRHRVEEVLDQLGLHEVRRARAGTLPTGTLRLVELGRALCRDPGVLLLDEPASGLDDAEVHGLQRVLREVAAGGVALVLVEHDVDLVLEVADRIVAMAEGRLLAEGTPEQIRSDLAVRRAYLDPAATP